MRYSMSEDVKLYQQLERKIPAAPLSLVIMPSAEKLGAKIREASFWKVPYKIVVGPRDEAAGTVSVRKSGEGDLGAMSLDDLLKRLAAEAQP
jgi:threonyl-tRNA synthetase